MYSCWIDQGNHFFAVLQPDLPGSQDGLRGSKASNEYLSRLAGYSLASLNSEPSRIADEADFVQRELTGLCSRESKTFIDVHACSASVSAALDDFSASLDDLFEAIPELEDECLSFAKSTRGIQSDRERASVILDQRDSLLDILEVPQLVDTCVRNGYYQEAMELATHINGVAQRYPDLAIVRSVARSIDSVMDMQLSQLLGLLRDSIKLPVMAKTIGFLRRMDRLSEEELRIVFLESRVDHMRNTIEGLQSERADKIRYLRRYIDLFREIVYETVSQYNSIFMNNGPGLSSGYRDKGALDLIARYVQHNVLHMTTVIDESLSGIQDSSSLSSLLTQLGYSTMSFARMGIDFTALLRNPFEKAIESLVATGWQLATNQVANKFEEAIKLELLPGSWLCSEEGRRSIISDASSPPRRPKLQPPPTPPTYLASFPPLAIYLNHGLSTLNSLRLLAPTRSRYNVNEALIGSLQRLTGHFLNYARGMTEDRLKPSYKRPDSMRRNTSISNQGQLLEQDRARTTETRRILVAAADAMLGVMFPYLLSAMQEVVYPSTENVKVGITDLGEAKFQIEQWLRDHRESLMDAVSDSADNEQGQHTDESSMAVQLQDVKPADKKAPAEQVDSQSERTSVDRVQRMEADNNTAVTTSINPGPNDDGLREAHPEDGLKAANGHVSKLESEQPAVYAGNDVAEGAADSTV